MAEAPSYYAIIPANVRYDQNLPGKAILLYGEITALCNQKGFCWASDDYFAKLYGVTKMTVQNWLKSLESENYISREVTYKKDTKEIEHRLIRIEMTPTKKNLGTPTQKNFRDNTTSINKNHSKAEKKDSIDYQKIIGYLNAEAGREYKNVGSNRKPIRARMNEGYSEHDFALVIAFKCKQWVDNNEMAKYLRPSTLFGEKHFDEYLNEAKQSLKKAKPAEPQSLSVGEGSARAANYLAKLEKQYEGD
ncbi:hypothetical protein CT113_03850 [Levilactobacillus brevis]|uniref:conserved phage C-terminal domain-containing protein n=1 Tax=Levilactobacillus brevis TaxID=1580 RepID=UPI00042669C6|nr:conserved phage C-terminal domain-containing protein [Levilactobacillus brevis]ATU69519.1 hypothetical protein CT113_03850 [Levilactobacillus brevis]